jgi:hypothetical protein
VLCTVVSGQLGISDVPLQKPPPQRNAVLSRFQRLSVMQMSVDVTSVMSNFQDANREIQNLVRHFG